MVYRYTLWILWKLKYCFVQNKYFKHYYIYVKTKIEKYNTTKLYALLLILFVKNMNKIKYCYINKLYLLEINIQVLRLFYIKGYGH